MSLASTNDDDLRKSIFENSCVIVKYHTLSCPICNQLLPAFEKLSQNPRYTGIKFLRMDAEENPVAKIFVKDQTQPFIATYKDGLLIECQTVNKEEQIINLLENLKKKQGAC